MSAVSRSHSIGNLSRSSSKTSVYGRYRKKADYSEVDELLFGNNPRTPPVNPPQEESSKHFIPGAHVPKVKNIVIKKNKPETVRVVTKDLIRDVVVPSTNPLQGRIVLTSKDFKKIVDKTTDFQDKQSQGQECKKLEREQFKIKMKERREKMAEYDSKRAEKEEKCNLFEETLHHNIAEEMIRKNKEQRLEENDEIKHLNTLILAAKCHAIRDAQIKEKKDLALEMRVENDRLDAMMEIDRVKAIQQQEHIDQERKKQRHKGSSHILNQIESNRIHKENQAEQKDREAKLRIDTLKKLQADDLMEIENKRKEQAKLQTEIDAINKEHLRQKNIRLEQERLADLRVIEYAEMKEKKKQSDFSLKEGLRKNREIEIAKLRAVQERATDLKAERDAIRAKRHEEATEREYRKKAREEQQKKARMDAEMMKARDEQIQSKRHLTAIQAALERTEFEKVQEAYRIDVDAMNKQAVQRHNHQKIYAKEIRAQIRDREAQRISSRKDFFNETLQKDHELEAETKELQAVKKNKLMALKVSGVPEKYVLEVARRTGLIDLND